MYYNDDLQHESQILHNRLSIIPSHRGQHSLLAPLCHTADGAGP